jgi:hypothetical protein
VGVFPGESITSRGPVKPVDDEPEREGELKDACGHKGKRETAAVGSNPTQPPKYYRPSNFGSDTIDGESGEIPQPRWRILECFCRLSALTPNIPE